MRWLHAAEDQARQQGKSLGTLIEEALRMTVKAAASFTPAPADSSANEGLEDNDPFFTALEEIRSFAVFSCCGRCALLGGGAAGASSHAKTLRSRPTAHRW